MIFNRILLDGLSDVNLPIVGATPLDPFILKSVDGLGPPDVDVVIANTLHQGGVYQGRRPLSREIVARVGLNPDYSVGERPSDLRTTLYGLLTPGEDDYVMVNLVNDAESVSYTTKAWVKRIEPAIFAKDPEVQIVLPCLQPYLTGIARDQVTVPGGWTKTNFTIINVATAPAGFQFQVTLTANASSFGITNTNGSRKMVIEYPFLNGDVIKFDTVAGQRKVMRTRSGTPLDVSGFMQSGSEWMMLRGGGNNFLTTGTSSFNWNYFNYIEQFWGI